MMENQYRRHADIGISFLKEAIAGVLREAKEKGHGGLSMANIAGRLRRGKYWGAIAEALGEMESEGEVVNDRPGPMTHSWRIAD